MSQPERWARVTFPWPGLGRGQVRAILGDPPARAAYERLMADGLRKHAADAGWVVGDPVDVTFYEADDVIRAEGPVIGPITEAGDSDG